MRVLIPISGADVIRPDALMRFIAPFKIFGGLERHHIMLVPTPTQIPSADIMAEEFSAFTSNVKIVPLPQTPRGGWPVASNNHFGEAALLEGKEAEDMPWLWMEMDSFFTCEGVLDQLANEILQSKNSFLGHVIETEYYNRDDETRQREPGDSLMLGVAVYPHGMGLVYELPPGMSMPAPTVKKNAQQEEFEWRKTIAAELKDLRLAGTPIMPEGPDEGQRIQIGQSSITLEKKENIRLGAVGEPFDWYLRHSILRGGRQHTRLIGDQWNTGNYRIENGQMVCDALPLPKHMLLGRNRGGVVDGRAVLVHGCKDSTGHDLAAKGMIPRQVYIPVPGGIPTRQAQAVAADPTMAAILVQLAAQQSQILQLLAKNQSPAGESTLNGDHNPGQPAQSAREKAEAANAEALKKLNEPRFHLPKLDDEQMIRAALGDKSKTAKTLARETGLTIERVKEIVEAAPDMELGTNVAGWCKVRKEELATA